MIAAAPRLFPAVAACTMLGACSQADPDPPGPGAVSAGEAQALEQAAEMLEEQRMPAEAAAAEAQDPPPAE